MNRLKLGDMKGGMDAQGPWEFEFDSSGINNAFNGATAQIMGGEFLNLGFERDVFGRKPHLLASFHILWQ